MPMQKNSFAGGDPRQDVLLLVGADAQDQRAGLAIGDPVQRDRRTGGQHFLQHDVAFQRGALMAAILLRPGHADPAARPILRLNSASMPVQDSRVLHRLAIGQLGFQEVADFQAQSFGFGRRRWGREAEGVHRRGPRGRLPAGRPGVRWVKGRRRRTHRCRSTAGVKPIQTCSQCGTGNVVGGKTSAALVLVTR